MDVYISEEMLLYPVCIICGHNIEVVWGESTYAIGKCGCEKGRPIALSQWLVLERFSAGVQTLVLNARYPYSELSGKSRGDVEREVAEMIGTGVKEEVLRTLRGAV